MKQSYSKVDSRTFTNRKYLNVSTDDTNDDHYSSFTDHQQQSFENLPTNDFVSQWSADQQSNYDNNQNNRQPLRPTKSASKSSGGSRVQKIHQDKEYQSPRQQPVVVRHRNRNKNTLSQSQMPNTKVAKELTSEHLRAIRIAFEKILHEQFLSHIDHDEHRTIYDQIREIILRVQPDAQISLYGSLLFNCSLKESNNIDMDVQFNHLCPYETLKELLNIILKLPFCKDARIMIDREPLSLEFSIVTSDLLIRITSENTQAIQLSQIIDLYTKFDQRVLPLFRLFRFLAKTCQIDRCDLGIVHPVVFHLMIIHFLQQIDPPILPCLHEYVFGIDHIPMTLNNDQYDQFDRISNELIHQWKSQNTTTTIEMLFLQILSYYVYKFNSNKFIVSIQTRMPIVKNERQMFNRKLFCADPTLINGNLCYRMKATCSYNYFQRTLKRILNYFCQRHSNNDNKNSIKQIIDILDKSYQLFIEYFYKRKIPIHNFHQEDIRQCYKQFFKTTIQFDPLTIDHQRMISIQNKVDQEEEEQLSRDLNSLTITSTIEFIYDMQAKNFGAEKGAPSICSICYRNDHRKIDCPDLVLPKIRNLPRMSSTWIDLLSRICRYITNQCQVTNEDIRYRQEILHHLENQLKESYSNCRLQTYGSSENGFAFRQSDLDLCILVHDHNIEYDQTILENFFQLIIERNNHLFTNVEFVRHTRVPIIRLRHLQSNLEVDITLENTLAMENTRLLKVYTQIDSRLSELGYMIKYLIKGCDIGDVRRGTLSSYAYILMMIHFLQQIYPPVLPVLQQLNDHSSKRKEKIDQWDTYFYDDLSKLNEIWRNENQLTSGQLWIEFFRYYLEVFDYEEDIVSIRQLKRLKREEKGWFHQTIAIEDPFVLNHNLAEKLSLQKWTFIRHVFIRAREHFSFEERSIDIHRTKISDISEYLFDINALCPERFHYSQTHSNQSSRLMKNNHTHQDLRSNQRRNWN